MRTLVFPLFLSAGLAACDWEACDLHTDCHDDEVCVSGECQPIFERRWEIAVLSASTGWTHPDGGPFDPDLSPPDLFVDVGVDGIGACSTSTEYDSWDPSWAESCTLWIPADPILFLDLWDADGHTDEWVAGWEWVGRPEVEALVRDDPGTHYVTDASETVVLAFDLWPR